MRTRLLFCLAGASLGAAVALPINPTFNLNPVVGVISCGALGAVIGCFFSVFIDVFIAGHEE